MSAQLRSLLDFLSSPLRLWRRGRRLPARVQAVLLVVAAACVVAAVTLWTVVRAAPTQEPPDAPSVIPADPVPQPVELAPAPDLMALYERIRQLRTQDKDYAAAQALALDFLQRHPERDALRQQVYFEYAMTLFDAQNWPAASAAFQALVAEYGDTTLDCTAPDFVVDDAAYYAAVTEHYHGDKARGIALYEAFLQDFPESNRRPKALLMLAGAHEQSGDLAAALPVFEQLAREHPESEYAPEAQIHVGHIRMRSNDYRRAFAAFQSIPQRWPESKHVPTALQFANRALIHEELADWEPKNGQTVRGTVDNSATVDANVSALVERFSNAEVCPGVLLDAINYYNKRSWYQGDPSRQLDAKIQQLVAVMRQVSPDDRATVRGLLDLAVATWEQDQARAMELVDQVEGEATARKDASLYLDARCQRAEFLMRLYKPVEARAIWEELLQRDDLSVLLESEIKTFIACAYAHEEDHESAVAMFAEVANNESYADGIRAAAMCGQASELVDLKRVAEALQVLDDAIAKFPNVQPTETARTQRDRLRKWRRAR